MLGKHQLIYNFVGAAAGSLWRLASQFAENSEGLVYGKVPKEYCFQGHYAHHVYYRVRLSYYFHAKYVYSARRGEKLGGNLSHQGRFARSVGAEHVQDCAWIGGKRDVAVGPETALVLLVDGLGHQGQAFRRRRSGRRLVFPVHSGLSTLPMSSVQHT